MLDTTNLEINLDLDSLTLGEMIDIEDIAGVPIGDLGAETALSAKSMLAMVYVTLRRTHPDVTLDDVKNLDVSVLSNPVTGNAPEKKTDASKSTSKPG